MDRNSLAEIRKRAHTLHINGFGFQPCGPSTDGLRFAICRMAGEQVWWVSKMARKIGVSSLKGEERLGRVFLTIDYSDYDKIDLIFTHLIKKGHIFTVHNNPGIVLGRWDGPREYNSDIAEQEIIRQYKAGYRTWTDERMFFKSVNESLCDPWNYKSPEGKQFSAWLREGVSKYGYGSTDGNGIDPVTTEDSKDSFLNWIEFTGFNIKTLLVQ